VERSPGAFVTAAVLFLAAVSAGRAKASDTLNFVGDEILGRPTDHSVTVTVIPRTLLEVQFDYGSDTLFGSTTPPETTQADTMLTVVLEGLAPTTRYYYRMRYRVLATGDSFAYPSRTFHTQRLWGERFVFDVEADPHMLPDQGDTAPAFELTLANIAADSPDFLIDLGDNFMTDKWRTPDPETILMRMRSYRRWWSEACHSIPLLITLGNHEGEQGWDLDSTPDCTPVLFTNARKNHYANPVPDGFYTGDTIPELFVGLRQDYYAWNWGNALFVVLDPYWHTSPKPTVGDESWYWTLGRAQYDWLKTTLEQSSAKFKFVFIHHLVGGKIDATARGGSEYAHYYEWGGKNSDSTWGWDTLRPGWGVPIHQMLIDNRVDILWHGHDHFYAKQDTDGVVYQMVPQPGRTNYVEGVPGQAAEYGYLSGVFIGSRGHVRVTMDDTSATVEYVRSFFASETSASRQNGMVAHSYTIVRHDTTAVAAPALPRRGLQCRLGTNPIPRAGVLNYVLPYDAVLAARLYDPTGRQAKRFGPSSAARGAGEMELDLRGIPAGAYFLRVTAGDEARSLKLVVN
jgi:hypothetical protein